MEKIKNNLSRAHYQDLNAHIILKDNTKVFDKDDLAPKEGVYEVMGFIYETLPNNSRVRVATLRDKKNNKFNIDENNIESLKLYSNGGKRNKRKTNKKKSNRKTNKKKSNRKTNKRRKY